MSLVEGESEPVRRGAACSLGLLALAAEALCPATLLGGPYGLNPALGGGKAIAIKVTKEPCLLRVKVEALDVLDVLLSYVFDGHGAELGYCFVILWCGQVAGIIGGIESKWLPKAGHELVDAAHGVFQHPPIGLEEFDRPEGLVNQFRARGGAAIGVFFFPLPGSAVGEVRARRRGDDRIHPLDAEFLDEVFHAEPAHIAKFALVLDVEGDDCMPSLGKWSGPIPRVIE